MATPKLTLERSKLVADRERDFVNMLLESLPGILYLYSSEGRFLRWSRSFELVSGYSAEEIGRLHPLDFFAPEHKPLVRERIARTLNEGLSWVEAPFLHKDGRSTPYMFTGRRVFYEDTVCVVGMGIDISERVRAHEALKRSEERVRSTLDSVLEGCQLLDFDWRYLYLNETASLQNRRPSSELLGRTMPECWPGIDTARHGAEALLKARSAQPDVVVSDLLMPVMDGFTLLRHWKVDPQLRAAPFVVYTATYTDAEDEQLALDLGADAFILKPSEPNDFLSQIRMALARTKTAEPASAQRMPTREGEVLLREYSTILIRKLEEKTLQLEASNRSLQQDIRARERAEASRDEAQRQAAERTALLDAVFASVPDTVVQLDLSGAVRLINRRSPLFDETATPGFACGPPEQRAAMQQAFEHVIAASAATSFEISVSGDRNDATYWITLAPVVRAGGITGAVAIVRDISERRLTEAQLIVADRMASVGSLAAGVAHEINNPLQCVTGNLALLELELSNTAHADTLSPYLYEALRDAREGAERVRLIVRDLRIFTRAEDVTRAPVHLPQVLDSTLRMAWNELRHRARLIKRYGEVPSLDSNEARLGQVFLNLIVNAVQAIPEGNYERNQVSVETSFDPETQRALVAISDTGSGIPPELQKRLFTPFVSTKPPGVGTGLGLSICQRIVTSLGGSIEFDSEVGRGTTFRVYLPATERVVSPEPPKPLAVVAPARSAQILLIDDDDMVAQVVRRALMPEHSVLIVNSAEAALSLFRRGELFDVVMCDLMMPQVTGMELFHRLQLLDPDQASRVVFVSGGAFTPSARAFLDSVPNKRLEKPFEIDALRQLVQQLIA